MAISAALTFGDLSVAPRLRTLSTDTIVGHQRHTLVSESRAPNSDQCLNVN